MTLHRRGAKLTGWLPGPRPKGVRADPAALLAGLRDGTVRLEDFDRTDANPASAVAYVTAVAIARLPAAAAGGRAMKTRTRLDRLEPRVGGLPPPGRLDPVVAVSVGSGVAADLPSGRHFSVGGGVAAMVFEGAGLAPAVKSGSTHRWTDGGNSQRRVRNARMFID